MTAGQKVVQLSEKLARNSQQDALTGHLSSGGGDGTYSGMDIIDAKIATAEARTDTKFAELTGKLDVISTRLEHLDKTVSGLRPNIWLAALTAIGLTAAIVGYGATVFGDGLSASTIADQAADRASQQIQSELASYRDEQRRQGEQIDMLVKAIAPRTENGQPKYPAVPVPMPKNGANGSPMVPMMGEQ